MKICIDAGHLISGGDTGATGHGLKEQDITWLISNKLKTLLEQSGADVIMTRPTKETILGKTENESLNARSDICNQNNCDWLISIHCNCVTNPNANGTEVLVMAKGGQAEKLAGAVLNQIVEQLGTYHRGVKEQNCSVLRKTKCPAVLVETAFLSNEADSLLLRYRHDDFAKAIFDGFCDASGLTPPVRYSYDDIVNQMILDGVTTVESMAYWEQTLAKSPYMKTIVERYQQKVGGKRC